MNTADVLKILARNGLAEAGIRTVEALPEGTFNTVYRVRLTDGTGLVCKISPPPDTPILSYERGLSHGELVFYRSAATARSVPVPAVVRHDFDRTVVDGDVVIMTECPGRSWHSLREELGEDDQARLRHRLGGITAELHTVTGTGFGYPRETPLAATWRESFLTMFDTLCGDAEHYRAGTPVPVAELRRRVHAHADTLDEIETPGLVHFDLWNGNILVDLADGRPEISGVVDGERAFWGDPVAEFVSLALLGEIERDDHFLRGYREAGGSVVFDAGTRIRLALYRCYLYLIMLTESVPRGYPDAQLARLRRMVDPPLLAASAVLAGESPGVHPRSR
ncbi:phosphotransferase family protein [Amycolatopsis pigmentata]|uniref:Phosphotransferase family protein n=1 Tax=Amycolatopsis pigmentata TaxID=450801 RepID=A0ABW5FYS1_9PSEU